MHGETALGMKGNIQINKYINNFKCAPLKAKILAIAIIFVILALIFIIVPKVTIATLIHAAGIFTGIIIAFVVYLTLDLFEFVFGDYNPYNFWYGIFDK